MTAEPERRMRSVWGKRGEVADPLASHANFARMAERSYQRDGRAPVPKDARTSEVMSRIRAKNTKPELMMRSALRAMGLTGYRLHYDRVAGRPDIAFVSLKVAVFVHGCFWHSCPHCQRYTPKSNRAWWKKKLGRNVERDQEKATALRKEGWRVLTVWECQLRKDPAAQARRAARMLSNR